MPSLQLACGTNSSSSNCARVQLFVLNSISGSVCLRPHLNDHIADQPARRWN